MVSQEAEGTALPDSGFHSQCSCESDLPKGLCASNDLLLLSSLPNHHNWVKVPPPSTNDIDV